MLKCLKFNCFILQIQKVKSLVLSRYPHSDPPSRLDEDDLTGKTSNRAVENTSESEQRTVPPGRCPLSEEFDSTELWRARSSVGNDRSSHSRARTRLVTKYVNYEWASDSFAYLCPFNNSWYARASPRVKDYVLSEKSRKKKQFGILIR